jgi:hypothetical protein
MLAVSFFDASIEFCEDRHAEVRASQQLSIDARSIVPVATASVKSTSDDPTPADNEYKHL